MPEHQRQRTLRSFRDCGLWAVVVEWMFRLGALELRNSGFALHAVRWLGRVEYSTVLPVPCTISLHMMKVRRHLLEARIELMYPPRGKDTITMACDYLRIQQHF